MTRVLWSIAELSQTMVHNVSQRVAVRFAIRSVRRRVFPIFLLFVKNGFAPCRRATSTSVVPFPDPRAIDSASAAQEWPRGR
jgi:hypothetical protein